MHISEKLARVKCVHLTYVQRVPPGMHGGTFSGEGRDRGHSMFLLLRLLVCLPSFLAGGFLFDKSDIFLLYNINWGCTTLSLNTI